MHFSGQYRITSGGVERVYCCPFCVNKKGTADAKFNLYVHACAGNCIKCQKAKKDLRGHYVCGRCGTKGHTPQFGGSSFVHVDAYEVMGILLEPEQEIIPEKIEVKPEGLLEITPGMKAYKYLIARGLTQWQIDYYQLKLGTGKLSGRIVVPNLAQDGTWSYWVARAVAKNNKMRYICPDASIAHKNSQVFNLARLQSEEAIIVEGVFSAMCTGIEAIALYGKKFAEEQLDMIANSGIERAWCALDPDAQAENLDLAKRLHRKGIEVHIVQLPTGKDPADLGRVAFMEFKKKAIPFDPENEMQLILQNSAFARQEQLRCAFEI